MKRYLGEVILVEDTNIIDIEDKMVVYKKQGKFQLTTTAIIREMYLFPELISFFNLIIECKFKNEINGSIVDTIQYKVDYSDYKLVLEKKLINKAVIFSLNQESEFVTINYGN